MRRIIVINFIFIFLFYLPSNVINAQTSISDIRLAHYKKVATLTQLDWYYLAAIDQYERSINKEKSDDEIVSISIPFEQWFGLGNHIFDQTIHSIQLFNGIGQDGDGDGKADPNNPEDVLMTTAKILLSEGVTEDNIRIALWNHYKRDLSVKTIMNIAKVYKQFNSIELTDRDFPVDIRHNYSYRNTWGDRRGYGGNRIHEGTDIFASYGAPVKSTTYGVVEIKGWNRFGGWRIGIRDIHAIYHYFAHLNSFNDEINVGDVVKPGDVLGTVGSSGYGPPGTAGKFPPHLHYGMYKDNGRNEWSFDPYPYLRRWEQIARSKK